MNARNGEENGKNGIKPVLPVLLTASVSTRGMKGACFSDKEREDMYIETLGVYCREILAKDPARKIVFADNSGWDLKRICESVPEQFRSRIEFISLDPCDYDNSKGKGYNESILMTQAISKSAAIGERGAFFKVTGRYPVYNLAHFLAVAENHLGRGGRFYGDIKDHGLYDFIFKTLLRKPERTWNGHAAYTVLFAATVDFYMNELWPLHVQCNDYEGRCIEDVWFGALGKYRGVKDCGISLRFDREPVCGGLQGSSGDTISFSKDNASLKSRIMRFAGNFIRTVTPWFWF